MSFDADSINKLTPEDFEVAVRESAKLECDIAELEGREPHPAAKATLEMPEGQIAERRRNHLSGGKLLGRYSLFWSERDGEYVAIHTGFPALSWSDEDPVVALTELRKVLETDLVL